VSIEAFEDADLPGLVACALEMRDQGIEPPLEELCQKRPDLLDALRRSLEFSSQIPDLQRMFAGRDQLAGRVLDGRYQLESRLGSGAMGVVYKGLDLELGREVAIKILRLPVGDEDAAEARFTREAEALGAIRHTSVVTIHDRGRTGDDDPYLVMEYVEGLSLSALLVEVKRAPGDISGQDTSPIAEALAVDSIGEPSYLRAVVRWAADLANGLAVAHEKGIFHRDIKPSNILVRRDSEPVLVDFGIAAQTDQATLTRDGSLVGTPAFMAPEALEQGALPSPALDIYGLTATLYQMLTLRPPYSGTPTQVLSALSHRDPVPAGRIREGVPEDLLAILDRGMARRPSDRYPTIGDLEADLRAFLDYRPVQARPLGTLTRVWRKVRRSAAWRAGAAVAGVALLLVLTVQVRSVWKNARANQLRDVWRHLPPSLGIAGAATRQLTVAEGRDDVQALLDLSVDLSASPIPATFVRALFRYDHGQFAGAAGDMQTVADSVDSVFAHALGTRYLNAVGTESIELTDLPKPKTSMDSYLAAVHSLRNADIGAAKNLLEDPRLSNHVPSQELLTLITSDRSLQLEKGLWLEERIGCRTANTASLIGLALLLKQEYRASYRALEEAIELAPNSHALNLNAARAAWMLDQRERAHEHYRRVIALRPDNSQGHELYIRFLSDSGWTEQAQAVLDAAPFGDHDEGHALRMDLQGGIETERALAHRYVDELGPSRAAAERATKQFESARALGRPIRSTYSGISSAIANGDSAPVFGPLIKSLAKNPLNSRRLQLLDKFMPKHPSVEQAEQTRSFVSSVRKALVTRGLTEASD
jgi:tRNA A-37 threonylcarbamoyl transferase component Bud32/tetratricopeptide (TPR) repeat protein